VQVEARGELDRQGDGVVEGDRIRDEDVPSQRPDGQVDPNRLTPRNAGFGAVTSAQAMRSIQAQIRFSF